ncbi:MAG: hypothetical protein ACHQNA_04335 [Acidimicrobiales bacterium]
MVGSEHEEPGTGQAVPRAADAPPDGHTAPTWGPYPGDALAPPPTPQAPEIPMSTTWPWVAGAAVVLRILLPIIVVAGIVFLIVAAIAGWL